MVYSIGLISLFAFALITRPLKKSQKDLVFSIMCFLLLAVMSGIRYQNEYSDFTNNYNGVITVTNQTIGEALSNSSQIGHQLFRKFVGVVFKDPQWYFILTAAFIVGMNIKIFKKYGNSLLLCVILFYAEFGYFSSNNITRQAVAVAITLCSWNFIIEKKLWKYLIVMALAILFHFSAIFFLPMYFVANINFEKKHIMGYTILGIIVVVFSQFIIDFFQRFLYSNYVAGSYGITPSSIVRLLLAGLCGVMLFIFVNLQHRNNVNGEETPVQKKTKRFNNFILNGTYIYVICIILSSVQMLMFSRVALFFAPCAVICIDNTIAKIPSKTIRIIIHIGVVLFCILWFSGMNYYGKLIPTPYTPFWKFPSRVVLQ